MTDKTGIFERNVYGLTEKLNKSVVGIAGCGGLGSNIAVTLVRAGIGKLIIADFDKVELSNLNRQHYFQSDINEVKVEALAKHLKSINPQVKLTLHHIELNKNNVPGLFCDADMLIEAFDKAESKKWLIESWLKAYPEREIICGNGLAGYGNTETLKVTKSGKIYFCGDGVSDMSMGLCSARVSIVANMQANIAIEILAAKK